MTKVRRKNVREQRRLNAAFISIDTGTSIRKAAAKSHLPPTTLHRLYHKQQNGPIGSAKPGRTTALTDPEEKVIVDTLLTFAARGFPLTRDRMLDAVALFCSRLPKDRQEKLPFKHGKPSLKFATSFAKINRLQIKFGKPSKEEGKRFRATNAVNLVSYAACLESIIRENGIDESRIANIEETGFSPDRDRMGSTQPKRFGSRNARTQAKLVTFSYRHRITLLPVVFANGTKGPALWVFKGKNIPYRAIICADSVRTETLSDCLPRDSRPQMSLEALEILEKGGIIAFALPAHTTGTIQPLDVGLFQPFKSNINRIIDDVAGLYGDEKMDLYDLVRILTKGYDDTFIPPVIQSAFKKAGVYPFDPMQYLGVSRPLSEANPETVVTVQQLEEMLKQKQLENRQFMGINPVVISRGYVDTSKGLQLTSKDVMDKVAEKEAGKRRRWNEKQKKLMEEEAKFARSKRARRNERARFERQGMFYRFKAYGDEMRNLRVSS